MSAQSPVDKAEQRVRKIISETIGFEFGHGDMQPTNDEDMERLAVAFAAALREQAGVPAYDRELIACALGDLASHDASTYKREVLAEQARLLLAASPSPPVEQAARGGVDLIAAERRRQIEAEGWTPEHDDEHSDGALAQAAACYAAFAGLSNVRRASPGTRERMLEEWPWEPEWWKPTDRIRDLVKAGALIVAEIERLQRATGERHV